MTQRAGQTLFALALAAAALTGCTTAGAGGEADKKSPSATASPSLKAAPAAKPIPFKLYTHCGIDEARIGSTYYEAETPLSNGAGSPPEGWDNPYQSGTMTVTSGTRAVFKDDAGHEVTFRARPGATSFKLICR
ncbi:hypothetical protein [Streptomyces sp. NPDC020681]|uniref:hypothetical protein n=1 Tax=Streptomyces sp. NPDC020681 TaxID=3365083 RepID=UPI00379401EC